MYDRTSLTWREVANHTKIESSSSSSGGGVVVVVVPFIKQLVNDTRFLNFI